MSTPCIDKIWNWDFWPEETIPPKEEGERKKKEL